jgi:predicted transcriptional regulator
VEIEAEAVAFIVTMHAGLTGSSAAYVSRYLSEGKIPSSVSLNLIAKVAGRIEEMGRRTQEARRQRRKEGRGENK